MVASKKTLLEGRETFSLRHRLFRFVWNASWLVLASWTPPALWRWRRFLLISFGARLAKFCDVRGSARVWFPPNLLMEQNSIMADGVICYNVAQIVIRERAVISQRAHLCSASHDVDDPGFELIARPIEIGVSSWIAAEAFVGPGVSVGEGAVLGARAATFRDLDPWTIYRGNPAEKIRRRILIKNDLR